MELLGHVHTCMSFCKQLLGVKTSTQNDFIYGELGRTDYYTKRIYIIIKYWFKVVYADERKYISEIYKVMLNDIRDNQSIQDWASLVKIHWRILDFSMYG